MCSGGADSTSQIAKITKITSTALTFNACEKERKNYNGNIAVWLRRNWAGQPPANSHQLEVEQQQRLIKFIKISTHLYGIYVCVYECFVGVKIMYVYVLYEARRNMKTWTSDKKWMQTIFPYSIMWFMLEYQRIEYNHLKSSYRDKKGKEL